MNNCNTPLTILKQKFHVLISGFLHGLSKAQAPLLCVIDLKDVATSLSFQSSVWLFTTAACCSRSFDRYSSSSYLLQP